MNSVKAIRAPQLLWIMAAIFVFACFFSGAWLGKTLSTIPQVTASTGASSDERSDQDRLRMNERQTAIATAIASPVAILILFVTGLIVSGIAAHRKPD